MIVKESLLKGVKIISQIPVFEDYRGFYKEIYNREYYKAICNIDFVQDDISVSSKNVFRGIHGDEATWKLVSCLRGKFWLVVVNNDKESEQYKKWESFILSDSNDVQILIPPKFGNGHLVLSDEAIFHYKQSTYYKKYEQFTLFWNDPLLNITWPLPYPPIVSQRDKGF